SGYTPVLHSFPTRRSSDLPAMKAVEITDTLIHHLRTDRPRFARVNYANGDMVGHTGDLQATIAAVQVVDLQLARLQRAVDELDRSEEHTSELQSRENLVCR